MFSVFSKVFKAKILKQYQIKNKMEKYLNLTEKLYKLA